jgi:fibronectin type 3 domain-containing protein/photosystem II stability/assembly factor-like uncharacterized protein
MLRPLLFLAILLSVLATPVLAQPWQHPDSLQQQGQTFYDIQRAYYDYWKTHDPKVKGSGWKQFKRWEWFWEQRVYPTGEMPDPMLLWKEWEKEQEYIKKDQKEGKRGREKTYADSWTPLGPNSIPPDINPANTLYSNGVGRINCIRFSPTTSSTIWVGSAGGGLWQTTDGGTTWSNTTDNFPTLGVSDIAINSTNPNIMYLATGDADGSISSSPYYSYSVGILKSVNSGRTWSPTNLAWSTSSTRVVYRLLLHPVTSNILLAASTDGIWRSTDEGTSWSQIGANMRFTDMEFHPTNANIVYAAKYTGVGGWASIYVSTNAGISWSLATSVLPTTATSRIALSVTPAAPDNVYALYANNTNGFLGLYLSTNAGVTWSTQSSTTATWNWNILNSEMFTTATTGQASYDLALAVSPTNANSIIVGGINIWHSTNAGITWEAKALWDGGLHSTPTIHADHHDIVFYPGSETIYVGTDGGIWWSPDATTRSTSAGVTWFDNKNNGLAITQFYRLGCSATNANVYIGGAQDNGTILCTNATMNGWRHVVGGDGMECILDYSNPNYIYACYITGQIRQSTNAGASFASIQPPATTGAWITPYLLHHTNPQIIFAGYDRVYRSDNRGSTWSVVPAGGAILDANKLRSMALSPSDPNVLYVAGLASFYQSTTAVIGGIAWTNRTTSLPPGIPAITSIAVHPHEPTRLWLSVSGYQTTNKVFVSDNGGASWSNYSTGLPNLPVNSIIYQKDSPDLLYAGTDLGIYYRYATMETWQPYKTDLPNTIITELEIQQSMRKLRAATYGRSMWQADLINNFPKILVISPNGGETLITGSTATIRWFSTATIASVNIEYTINSGATWSTIATGIVATTGTIPWFVPNTPTTQALIRITNTTVATMSDVSDAPFTIAPAIRLLAPNGGTSQSFPITATTAIVWSVHTMATVTTLTIQYRLSSTAAWSTITSAATSVGTTGSYTWTVPAPPTTQASVRILFVTSGTTPAGGRTTATIEDASDSVFAVTNPLRVLSPNGKEQIPIASAAAISWSLHPQAAVTSLTVQYRLSPGTAWITVTNATVAGTTGSCVWQTPAHTTTQASVRISFVTTATTTTGGMATATVEDTSDLPFSLVKPIRLLAPVGGICWPMSSTATIQWSIHTQATVTSLTLQYRLTTAATWTTIATVAVVGTTGSYTWTTPTQATTQASVRILYTTTASITTGGITTVTIEDENASPFSIGSPMALLAPNGGETFAGGTQTTIWWRPDSSVTYVMLEYSLNAGLWWTPISIASNTGSYLWTVPDTSSSLALVRVREAMSTTAGICTDDISDSTFSILQIVAPPSGLIASWSGSAVQLYWTASPSPGVSGYHIYRRLSSSATFTLLATVLSPMTFYADSTAALGTSYDYAVTAFKSSIQSGFSNIVTITPAIAPPSGLTAYWSSSAVQLYWTASPSPGVIAYNVYRRLSSSSTFTLLASVASPATFYIDSTALAGVSYDYAVTALTSIIESGFSNIVTIAPPSVLPPPTITGYWSGSDVQLYWMASPSAGVIAYNVYRRQYPSTMFIPIATVTAPTTFYIDNTALPGWTYEYAVTALTSTAESGFSPIVTITIASALAVLSPNGGEVLTSGTVVPITWTAIPDTLRLEYSCNNGISWNLIGTTSGMSTSFSWVVPNLPTVRARVRISSLSGLTVDISDNNFTIRSGTQTALNVRLILEGAYDPMRIMLPTLQFIGQLPLSQPYNTPPFFYAGGETRGNCVLDSIVDWVLVELRSNSNPTIVIARTAALLRTDGALIDETGNPEALLTAPPGTYYVVLQHRNHLEVMSAVPIPLSIGSSSLYTFTISQAQAYIISMPSMRQLGTGIYGLSAGDVNGDGVINATDRVAVINAYGMFGYRVEDVSLDGIVNALDYVLTNNNQFITSQVP